MLAKILSGATFGLKSVLVTVEVDIFEGLPRFNIVGLPDKAVDESKERVRSAVKNSGANFPDGRKVVNLAPADLPKEGPQYDLPIALGILIASGQIDADLKHSIFIGELSLDGTLRHTNGILPKAILAKEKGIKNLFIPEVDSKEAAVISGIKVYPVKSLVQLFRHFIKTDVIKPIAHIPFAKMKKEAVYEFDLKDVRGQEQAKRALEIAASGGHNIFFKGPPGAGKTMLARTIPSILPDLTEKEAFEVTKIYSITGNLPQGESVMKHRPFRAPHHTTSRIGLIGGGANPMPGEISLAHRGVLFLDEFPEFPRNVLEALRQPIEDGTVSISRAKGAVTYPAKFLLVAAANPCPCGNYGSVAKRCTCMPGMITRYQKRISGPILDRIDLHIDVPAVSTEQLTELKKYKTEKSITVKKRVQSARQHQQRRFSGLKMNIFANAEMTTKDVKNLCPLSQDCYNLLQKAVTRLKLSARSYYKMIKVARTISDLTHSRFIQPEHIAEALQYRPKDMDL